MADTYVDYNLIVFDVRDPEITYAYVRVDPHPGDPMDCHPGVFGWHGKAFPCTMTTAEISNRLFTSQEYDPLNWPNLAPQGLGVI